MSSYETKWKERAHDMEFLTTVLESRNNVFLYGTNGCGKTEFVHDCVSRLKNQSTGMLHIDCVEFYSERLISIILSQQINKFVQD